MKEKNTIKGILSYIYTVASTILFGVVIVIIISWFINIDEYYITLFIISESIFIGFKMANSERKKRKANTLLETETSTDIS